MKQILALVLIVMLLLSISGCGWWERKAEELSYRTPTGKTADVYYIQCGDTIEAYIGAKIIYSSSDSDALWIEDQNGNEHYLQGSVILDFH